MILMAILMIQNCEIPENESKDKRWHNYNGVNEAQGNFESIIRDIENC